MKWLLLTTARRTPETLNSNVGDEFACIGTENLIRAVDRNAEFDRLNVENPNEWTERPFDRCVFAGRPLWWSQRPGTDCLDHFWWEPIMRGWPTKNRRNFLVLGAGSVCVGEIHDTVKYIRAIYEVYKRAWAVTTRNTVLDHPGFIDSVCPSAFAVPPRVLQKKAQKVCNLMVDGGHFPLSSDDAGAWVDKFDSIVRELLRSEYTFVAHTEPERDLALSLGWKPEDVRLFSSAEEYLSFYARTTCYFGNRLHGAAVCAALGIPTVAVAYDTRLNFVRRLGARALRPSQIDLGHLKFWLRGVLSPTTPQVDLATEYERLCELLYRFAYE